MAPSSHPWHRSGPGVRSERMHPETATAAPPALRVSTSGSNHRCSIAPGQNQGRVGADADIPMETETVARPSMREGIEAGMIASRTA